MAQDLHCIQLTYPIDKNQHEEIMSCDSINNIFLHQEENNILWKLKRIVSHELLHIVSHPNVKGSWYKIMVEWGTGGTASEPPTIIIGY